MSVVLPPISDPPDLGDSIFARIIHNAISDPAVVYPKGFRIHGGSFGASFKSVHDGMITNNAFRAFWGVNPGTTGDTELDWLQDRYLWLDPQTPANPRSDNGKEAWVASLAVLFAMIDRDALVGTTLASGGYRDPGDLGFMDDANLRAEINSWTTGKYV